jgi:hypothetical protein
MAMIPWAEPKLSGTSVLSMIVAVAIALATVGLLQERHRDLRRLPAVSHTDCTRRAFHYAM